MQDNVHSCDDKDLGALLHRLFTEQPDAEDVEIQHPTDGAVVITRAEFYATVDDLEKARKMSPADRLMKKKQDERLKANLQTRFRTALVDAQTVEIDVESGAFGYDSKGEKIPVEGMTFVRVQEYPIGTVTIENEIGAFISETWDKPPVRVIATSLPEAVSTGNEPPQPERENSKM